MPPVVAAAIIGAAGTAAATTIGSRASSKATKAAANASTTSANYAAQLEADANAKALAFAKEQEAARQREWQQTQERNRAIYESEIARDQGRYEDLQARLAPYRQFGAGSLGQLMRPIGANARPGG